MSTSTTASPSSPDTASREQQAKWSFLLHDTARMMRRRFDERANELGLTRAQWSVLFRLARNEGVNQKTLAQLVDVEPMTLTRIVDRLERSECVERRADPYDRRAYRLYLTDKARPLLEKLQSMASETRADALRGIPPDEMQRLTSVLETIKGNLAGENHSQD